jgi:hypothetical protein
MICKLKGDDFEIITDVIEKNEGLDFNNYPNPVSSCLYINVKNIMNINVRVMVTDMLGRRYLEKDLFLDENTLYIDVTSLKSGTYLYQMEDENGRCVMKDKFVKK